MIRPSARAIAQALYEYQSDNAWDEATDAILERAEEIDATAAPVVVGEDMVDRAVDAYDASLKTLPVWNDYRDVKRHMVRAALTAALSGEEA